MSNKYSFIIVAFLCLIASSAKAQGIDPARATAFATIGAAANKVTIAQNGVITAQIATHIGIQKETRELTNFKKQFNDYLGTFEDILGLAAQLYGVYYEIDLAIKNVRNLKDVVIKVPENALAVSIMDKKNYIYSSILESGVKLAGDIESVLPLSKDKEKNPKMTQKERIMAIGNIRASLHRINMQMYTLYKSLKYTTLMDAWYYYTKHRPASATTRPMADIIKDCKERWVNNARGANKYNTKK